PAGPGRTAGPKGTPVRHVGYKLPKLEGSLGPSPGNLYHYLHCSVFDPLLPFRLTDLRGRENHQIVTGSRNRGQRRPFPPERAGILGGLDAVAAAGDDL